MSYVDWYGKGRKQNWRTLPAIFDKLNDEYSFTLDGASEPGNGLCDKASTADAPLSWEGERVFCNPPWSNIRPFVELAPSAELAALLVPARTNCKWFHRALELGADPIFFSPKPKFVGAQHTSPVDCLLLVFRRSKLPRRNELMEMYAKRYAWLCNNAINEIGEDGGFLLQFKFCHLRHETIDDAIDVQIGLDIVRGIAKRF